MLIIKRSNVFMFLRVMNMNTKRTQIQTLIIDG